MLNVIELFAGVGGFRLGLERNGNFQVVWGNQWEPSKKAQDAFDCYSNNFKDNGIHSNEDISTVSGSDIPRAEVLVGGFPCQDYSVARSLSGEMGIQGKKGVLFWEIMRLIEERSQIGMKPKYVLLENVDRLLKSPSKQRGRDFGIMLAAFNVAGYNVEWRVINAADYGMAQRRRRVFIFAYDKNLKYAKRILKKTDLKVLESEGFFAAKFPVTLPLENINKTTEGELTEDIVSVSDSYNGNFYNSGIMRDGKFTSMELIPIKKDPVPLLNILEEEVDEKYYLTDLAKEKFIYLKGPKKVERTAASGHSYIFSEGGMSLPEVMTMPGRTMLTSEGTVNRSTHVVPDKKTGRWRYLTPIECERLNGFPDDWTDTGMSERMRYFCMGNALVVNLIQLMADRIFEIENLEPRNQELDSKEEQITLFG
ncbi:DNA (cytosine-5-)-methyltransferase [Bacillus sp. FJAT-42376]|uniref:DNA (cytosine-5-)-methyltransferase n=1 Tax=Bacillus sp. FJAT-42376 TaxID=2014076 RepID=UPI000F4FE2DE|nr:DNA (cytosine-5-)-methyltransferase [Bacillus sp. FJAT-42376]AZB41512.1 DNA (cytosine-5-)-methyltransferase [Bacillus sp. FJAT-42376]